MNYACKLRDDCTQTHVDTASSSRDQTVAINPMAHSVNLATHPHLICMSSIQQVAVMRDQVDAHSSLPSLSVPLNHCWSTLLLMR